jgi:hypothetical protein
MKYNDIILENTIPVNFLKQAVKYVYNNNDDEQLIYHVKWYAEHENGQEEEEEEEEGWRAWRIAAENNTMKWRRAVKDFLEDRVSEIYDKITWLGRSGRIEIWREITAPENWKPTDDYPGIYWSWDQAAAEAHNGDFKSGNVKWILFTTVPMNFVNLFNSVVKNADLSIGDEEREIELKGTRPFPYKAIMKDNPKIHYDYIPKNKRKKLPYFRNFRKSVS